ncbi:MAG: hypothetical protein MUE41_18905 [Gemmatimonadaceae bacterium]|jgi:3-oxoacyl-[acyl-carrier-protein] synthase-1|nr:hypothetical protein [Gemmatimonadaceae bacterium]
MRGEIACVACAAQTAAGATAAASVTAARAGLKVAGEHPRWRDRAGDFMVLARAPWLEETPSVQARVTALADASVRAAVTPALGRALRSDATRMQLHCAVSRAVFPDAADRTAWAETVAHTTARATGSRVTIGSVAAEGHAAGFTALHAAMQALEQGRADVAVVVGADSWIDIDRLEILDAERRLHSASHSWGFTPGEGAGVLVLATTGWIAEHAVPSQAAMLGVALAEESRCLGTATVCTGEGLSHAVAAVLPVDHPLGHCFTDLNGEPYRADELAFVMTRVSEQFADPTAVSAGAACWGDLGAASVFLSCAQATIAWSRGRLMPRPVLVTGSSAVLPGRGALVLAPPVALAA